MQTAGQLVFPSSFFMNWVNQKNLVHLAGPSGWPAENLWLPKLCMVALLEHVSRAPVSVLLWLQHHCVPSSCKLAGAGSRLPFELIFPPCRMLHPPSHWVFNYYWSIGAQDKLFYINAPTEACCLTSYCVDACHKGNSFLLTSCVLCGYWSLSPRDFQISFPPCPSVLASCLHLGILLLPPLSSCLWAGQLTSGDSGLLSTAHSILGTQPGS